MGRLKRLVEVKDGSNVVQQNEYDGLNRRIVRPDDTDDDGDLDANDEIRHFYYNRQWQVVEERLGSATTADRQYVYHPHYVDAIAMRRDAVGNQHYYLQDANFNVTAVTDWSGTVVERYNYTPYGEVTIMDANFAKRNPHESDIDNELLYTGRRIDPETGLQLNRNRFYAAHLGRWASRDPIGYWGSSGNLYEYARGTPMVWLDPTGLVSVIITPDPVPEPDTGEPDYLEKMCCDAAGGIKGKTVLKCKGDKGPCNIDELLDDAVPDGECVSSLYIMGHGARDGSCIWLGSVGSGEKCKICTPADAKNAFGRSRKQFCKPCVITIANCHAAKNQAVMRRIAAETGCTVRATSLCVFPTSSDPFPDKPIGGGTPWEEFLPPKPPIWGPWSCPGCPGWTVGAL